jgi:truncated hemoglobin YjbI
MQRVDEGRIPAEAQLGLTQAQKDAGVLLPCCCVPAEDMVLAPVRNEADERNAASYEFTEEPSRKHVPDPEMWAALREGETLHKILTEFYTRVYADPILAPFFQRITRQRAIEKQFNFLYQVFTGEDVYFGERPRNAHHWMVISDEQFDYRERLMAQVLREYGLAEHLIGRWMEMEESYRAVIVKQRAWPKIFDGKVLPLEGYEALRMNVGSLCDGCSGEIKVGEFVQVHVRLGTTYCSQCAAGVSDASAA